MTQPSTRGPAGVDVAASASSRPTLLRPPVGSLARVRWVFLLFAAFFTSSLALRVAGASGRLPALRVAIVVLLVAVLAYWALGYLRSRFPLWGLLLEAAAIGLCVAGPDQPVTTVGVLYGAVAFRASYDSWRRAIGYIGVALTAYCLGLLLAVEVHDGVNLSLVLSPLPGVPVMGVIVHMVAAATDKAERATAREQVVSRSGLAIAVAEDLEHVRDEGLTAISALVQDVEGAGVRLVPEADQVSPPSGGARLVLPLRTSDRRLGDLVVDSDRPLPTEVRDALETVSAQLALGLATAALTADLRHRATHDPLTDLANRAAVDHALAQALTGSCDAALLLLDLDGFKQVNDDLGHAAGDLLLLTVADRLRAVVRSGDLVARLGGDEFVVLLRGPDAAEHGPASARRILDAISAPVSVRDRDVTVGVSVGLACARPGTSADQLLREADADMYRTKHRRKVGLASS